MSERIRLWLRWGELIAMCVLIFVFSSFEAHDSTEQSNFIVDRIIALLFDNYAKYSVPKQEALYSLLIVLVRKGAHFSEYALLAVLAFGAFVRIKRHSLRWLAAVGFAFVYACSDELHQTFVPGRAGMFRDVVVDTSGAACGALLACFISLMILARRVLRSQQKDAKAE